MEKDPAMDVEVNMKNKVCRVPFESFFYTALCFLFIYLFLWNDSRKQISHCVNCADVSLQDAHGVSEDIKRRFIFREHGPLNQIKGLVKQFEYHTRNSVSNCLVSEAAICLRYPFALQISHRPALFMLFALCWCLFFRFDSWDVYFGTFLHAGFYSCECRCRWKSRWNIYLFLL